MPKLRVIIKPPPEPQGDAEQQTEALRDYLLQMSEELAYVLTHLEADNINDSTFERIQSMIPRPYTGLPVMDGDASSGQSEGWARGDHRHPKDTSKADVTALATETAAREAHEADTGNPHEVTKAQVGLGNVANERQYSAQNPPPIPTPGEVGAIPVTEKGNAGGVAELDSNGMVPSAQLPSYVDDVLEYASLSAFPTAGESGKIYVALDTGRTYRWSGSAYVEISESLALGETSSTAYRGDRGKTAYDHSQLTSGNPHNVSASDVGLGNVANERQYSAQNPPPLPTPADIGAATAQDLTDHVGDTNNPHGVTAAQVGARPDTWTPSASDVGARPDDWVPDAEDVPYDNTGSGLMATDVQAAIDEIAQGGGGGGTAASAVSYDNTGSGLAATNVQDAIDEVLGDIPSQPSDIGAQDTITASGILKGDGQGGVTAATPGTDYGTYSKPSGGIPSTDMTSAVQTSLGKADTAYQKPSSGIPSSDMASGVQTSLGKADTAYQKPSGGIPASDLANGVIPAVPSAYTSNPAMDGTASPGSSGAWANGDHVHPSDTSRVPVYGMGENLLDNAYFVGGGSQLGDGILPINQRGQASYSTDGYTLDRWWFNPYSYGTLTLTAAGLQIAKNGATSSPGIRQDMEHDLDGQIVTFSALDDAGIVRTVTSGTLDNTISGWQVSNNFGVMWVGIRYISGKWSVSITVSGTITLAALKLEFGTQSTLTHTESGTTVIAVLPDFWAELANAQRYLKVINAWRDLYAARVDNSNLSFFIPGHMVKAPTALSSQQIYYYSASSGNITGNISFYSVPGGVCGYISRGSLSANTGGSVVFPAAVYISAEQ